HLPNIGRNQTRRAGLSKQRHAVTCWVREYLVRDGGPPTPGEHLNGGPVDRHVQAHPPFLDVERRSIARGESEVGASLTRIRAVDEYLPSRHVIADEGLFAVADAHFETEHVRIANLELSDQLERLACNSVLF